MKKIIAALILPVFLAGCAFMGPPKGLSQSVLEEAKRQIRSKGPVPLTAGVMKVEITPPVGTPLAGYSKRRSNPSTGIRDPLYVRTVVLSDGEDTVVLVSADLLLFPNPLANSIVDKLWKELKIPRRAIILTGTHTHSGAGSIASEFLYEIVFGRYRGDVAEGIAARVTWAVRQALEHQELIRWGVAEQKRLLFGLTENRMAMTGFVDPALSVFLVESMDGHPLAVLVNAAAHPTLMDSQDLRFSADYPGELARVIETTYPRAVCLFMNGAAGDLRPRGDIGTTPDERIRRFGQALAEGTVGMINQMSFQTKGNLAAWGRQIQLPPPQLHLGPIPVHPGIGQFMRPVSLYQNLVALDDVIFVPLQGEMTADLGWDLKLKLSAQGLHPLLLGYANGYFGYAVTPKQYKNGSYEAWMTWYGPDFGEFLIQKIQQLVDLYSTKK